eukprot:gnl/TRDRNA2_/TRDRNA2_201914_c0_seq1.p1 gnl/TRDRNA2_/TRDRNA2_201914_c0~~gnl/TRDRNA2_/TRDRNA2_201914_c0_seq1.p1  ORF type:complete len:133 (+),score=14.35 gnl/TRDRNA2_/TRDRNA2_201914_c0_seq1:41-400(+)
MTTGAAHSQPRQPSRRCLAGCFTCTRWRPPANSASDQQCQPQQQATYDMWAADGADDDIPTEKPFEEPLVLSEHAAIGSMPTLSIRPVTSGRCDDSMWDHLAGQGSSAERILQRRHILV